MECIHICVHSSAPSTERRKKSIPPDDGSLWNIYCITMTTRLAPSAPADDISRRGLIEMESRSLFFSRAKLNRYLRCVGRNLLFLAVFVFVLFASLIKSYQRRSASADISSRTIDWQLTPLSRSFSSFAMPMLHRMPNEMMNPSIAITETV